ncbi:MAG: formate dehydrogenase-N subunit alpha [Syntrophorhabdaceae bacterium]|nr:formate dehydrogenase-N subunit alpha [Syntrophorhabdaceae bacterium]
MTNHWIDLKNSDCIMTIGCNPAENHPISFKWIEAAIEKGAKLITIDPRYTRTASKADIYARLRPGTDVAFLGGLINYALQKNLIHTEYVRDYTNASFIVSEGFDFKEGMFDHWNEQEKSYDTKAWTYAVDGSGKALRDPTMKDPRCVLQLLKRHYSRYDIHTVCKITGTDQDDFLKAAEAFCSTGRPGRAGTILYAMGITQSTHGVQNVRAVAMLQMLLGNIGIAGGGVNALRGESNVQGSTDYGLLFHVLPGYLPAPEYRDETLESAIARYFPRSKEPKSTNWWQNGGKYMVSLLKAWWGGHATDENGYCFDYLPRRSGNHSYNEIIRKIVQGKMEGLLCMGMNPAVGGPNSGSVREGLGRLKWLVTADLWETETSIFWKRPGVDPKDIKTEVFMLPAAASMEKEGSISNSGRWTQWRYTAVEPPGAAKSDLWIVDQFHKKLKALYKKDGGVLPAPVIKLSWNYGHGHEPDVHLVAKEINGYFTRDVTIKDKDKTVEFKAGEQVPSFAQLQDDGSTVSGCWIYCGSYTGKGNMMARRDTSDLPNGLGMYPNWAWSWPVNRRILYNRASVNKAGRPLDTKRPVIAWNALKKKWEGDVPDGGAPPLDDVKGVYPFIMLSEGVGRLYALNIKDGPFPEHYEPVESPVRNVLSKVQNNPCVKIGKNVTCDIHRYPYIGTTYRVTEHWQAGAMTRNLPWLVELVPDMFVEISKSLASAKNIKNGDRVRITTERGSIEGYALVTSRMQPLIVDGTLVEQVGIPWHFGYAGLATGDSANILTSEAQSPVSGIPEFKAFLCNVEKGGLQV